MNKKFLVSILLVVLLGAGAWFWMKAAAPAAVAPTETPVPVTVQTARFSDFDDFVVGLGSVQAFNTVTVKSRIDGEIIKIAFKEGDFVKAGDILAEIDPRTYQSNLDQAVQKKKQDENRLENAQLDLDRYSKLGEFASRQQLDTQRATVKQLDSQIAADDAAIKFAQIELGYATIKAPISGKTGFKLVDEGNIINANSSTGIVVIDQVQPISVVFTEPEGLFNRIMAGMRDGQFPRVDVVSQETGMVLSSGVLSYVDNQIDAQTGTIHLKSTFENSDMKLWPGMTVSVRLRLNGLHNVVVVPDTAVQHGPAGLFVYKMNDKSRVEMQKVEIGPSFKGQTVVLNGLNVGENYVSEGQYRLQIGSLVVAAP